MADVTGPISTLPGTRRPAPNNARCDSHPDRMAVARIQGETDSFGSEQHDLCEECVQRFRCDCESEKHGVCDWCRAEASDLRPRRDFEEGMHGPVYQVCGACVRREYARLDDEERSLDDY